MKKIFALFTSTLFCLSLCSCSENSEDKNKTFEDFRNYISETALEDDYYIQISKTASNAQTLIEASKMNEDCAFMQYDYTGALKFYRDSKYTVVSAETFYVPEEKDAQWSDFNYESMAQQYREIISALCSDEIVNMESETPVIKSIDISENDSNEFPEKYSDAMQLAKKLAKHMTDVLKCDGFNIVQNNHEIAGQTVFHFHLPYTNIGVDDVPHVHLPIFHRC